MNSELIFKALKRAAWISIPEAFISLLFCTLMLGCDIFEMLMPCSCALFLVISFALVRIPFVAKRSGLKIAVSAALVIGAALCLHFF